MDILKNEEKKNENFEAIDEVDKKVKNDASDKSSSDFNDDENNFDDSGRSNNFIPQDAKYNNRETEDLQMLTTEELLMKKAQL